MKILKDILYKVRINAVSGSTNITIDNVTYDSRNATSETLFIAIKGTQADGHDYIMKAIELGAVAIVCEEVPEYLMDGVTFIKVHDSREALAFIAHNYYDTPSSKLKLIGVTGTNGKTTIVNLLFDLFRSMNISCGLISTVKYQINDYAYSSTHTTPDPLKINDLLNQMIEDSCEYCFMEVSSHAIHQKRIRALEFDLGIFTNITHDHLDYHKSFKGYINTKKQFFDDLSSEAFALYNADDKNGEIMVQNTLAKKYSFGIKSTSDFKGKLLESTFNGMLLSINQHEFYSRLIGEFNAYNLLAVYGVASLLKFDNIEVLKHLSKLTAAEGRFDYVISDNDKIIGIIDYAHTPDALAKVVESIQNIRKGSEQVISVIGCGGDRDAAKRPIMAKVASQNCDKVILTSDNPRNEDPSAIIREMEQGITNGDRGKVLSIADRREAIRTACSIAKKGDIILVAGKGHEKYQEILGKKYPFDDKLTLIEAFKELQK